MTIVVPDNYHARKTLEKNRITCIRQEQALRQDIRPLRIGFLPTEELSLVEQVNLFRPLGMSIIQSLPVMIDGIHSSDEEIQKVLRANNLDGLVIVGSGLVEPRQDFRHRLDPMIIELRGAFPIMGLGYGAIWMSELSGVGYRVLKLPRIGVWEVTNHANDHPVAGESDDLFNCPQVRQLEPQTELLEIGTNQGKFRILCRSHGEPLVWDTENGQWLMHLGNPEFSPSQMLRFMSQQDHFVGPEKFDPDRPVNNWKTHRNDFFTHWLKHCYNHMNSNGRN
jgi:homoserine O-succinyltransferase